MGKIDSVFEYAKKNKISFVDGDKKDKKNNSHSTWDTYAGVMKAYESWLQKTHGLKDITRAKPKHGREYMEMMLKKNDNGERGGSAWTISRFPHALHALQELARPSNVFKGLKLGNKDDLVKMKHEVKIKRISSESKALKATSDDFERVQAQILSSRSPRAREIAEVHAVQRGVGCRIHEAVKMTAGDVRFDDTGYSASIYIKGKGGQERWVEVRDPATLSLLQSKMEGKKDGATLFPLRDRNNNDKTRKGSIKQVQKVVEKAATRAGVHRGGATYNTHSARKVFAQERVNYYSSMSHKQLVKELARRISTHQSGKLGDKAKSELKNIRNKIKLEIGGKRTAEQGQKLRNEREFNHKELVMFLTSVDTGHFRLDIIRYYATYPLKN